MNVPQEYMEFQDILSKAKAAQLHPYRSWDCATGAMPPRSKALPSFPT